VDARRVTILRARLVATLTVLSTLLSACAHGGRSASAPNSAPSSDVVVVVSFNFPESELLAEIYAQALEHNGVPVRRAFDLGPRELVQPALRQGLADVVPEYLGSALASIEPAAPVEWTEPRGVLTALRRALAPSRLVALQAATASDQNGFAVTTATAARLHLRTLTDLAAVTPPLVLGGPTECPTRPYCLAGLRDVYGLKVKQFLAFDDEKQRATALDEGVIDVAVTFTTDGQLATGRLVLLRDDRRLQPTEEVVPVVSSRAIQRYGAALQNALDSVSAALDSRSLRFLNWRITVAGQDYRAEARGWLQRHGLLPSR
jgi:osmoprotectant transport system substrate-binding protein